MMAIYYCHECDHYIDDDYHPGEEHRAHEGELTCPTCIENLDTEEEAAENVTWSTVLKTTTLRRIPDDG